VIADRDAPAGRKTAAETELAFIRCDVARESDVRAGVRQVLGRCGRLDALVNNAGIASPGSSVPSSPAGS